MWDKITSFLFSHFIPATLVGAQAVSPVTAPPLIEINIQPLALQVHEEFAEPVLASKAALVIETNSNEALYAQNVWEPLPIASLTKLMTALVAREKLDLEMEVVVSAEAANTPGSQMGLISGEKILVKDLFKGLLITSGNDAAVALSEAVSGSQSAFVELMNERTQSLGLSDTVFKDPAGLQDGNVSSAFEVAHLAKQVFKDPFLSSIMREKEITVRSVNDKHQHPLKNTNRLLGTDIADRIIAGKTGTTPAAGQCLISFFNGQSDRTIMIILLGSSDRFAEVKTLIGWVDENFSWE